MESAMSERSFTVQTSERIKRLPPYLFARINKLKHEMRLAGRDVIDLGMGNPNDPTPSFVVDKLAQAAKDPKNHRYSVSIGLVNLRREVAKKYERRFGVTLDPDTEVIATIGSKEGFAHFCLAMLGPGDTAIVAEPAYPIHIYAVTMAGANVIRVPLGNDQAFLDRVEKVIEILVPRPKMLVLNYPHNPTAMTVDDVGFFDRAVELGQKYNMIVVHDYAYGDVCFDGYKAPSFLQAKNAKKVGVEFSTMSKSYNMAGWRIGFCCGNAEMVKALSTVKGYYDYGIFAPIQVASIVAMRHGDDSIAKQVKVYESRRNVLCDLLDKLGWVTERPRASMFVWTRASDQHLNGKGTIDLSLKILEEAEVVLSPGAAFGEHGEGYFRIALVENEKRLRQAFRQIDACLNKGKKINTAKKRAIPAGAEHP